MTQTDSDPELNVDTKIWNHHPSVPIQIEGIFRNILNPFAVLKGIAFLGLEPMYAVCSLVLLYFYGSPSSQRLKKSAEAWVYGSLKFMELTLA